MKKMTFAIVAAVLCAAQSYAAIRAVTPTPRDGGNSESKAMKRHAKKVAEAKKGGAKIVFVGDSITHNWENRGAKVLKKHFSNGDWKMFNLGTGADHTEHVIWRLENGELDGFNAKCVHVLIGTNNTGHNKFHEEPPSDTILGIRKILQIIREKQPKAKIILSSIFPREGPTSNRRMRNDIVNAELSKLCDGKTIVWCDFRDKLLKDDGELPADIFPDALHPNEAGYKVWAENVKPFIAYGLRNGTPPVSPAAKDPRPGVDADPNPRAARPSTRLESLVGGSQAWADRLLADRNKIVAAKSGFGTVFLGDVPLAKLLDEKVKATWLTEKGVFDLGYDGDRTENVLWRAMNGELEGYKPKRVVVSAGSANADDEPEDIAAGVKRILETVVSKSKKAKLAVVAVPADAYGADKAEKAAKVNELLKAVAGEMSAKWVERK